MSPLISSTTRPNFNGLLQTLPWEPLQNSAERLGLSNPHLPARALLLESVGLNVTILCRVQDINIRHLQLAPALMGALVSFQYIRKWVRKTWRRVLGTRFPLH